MTILLVYLSQLATQNTFWRLKMQYHLQTRYPSSQPKLRHILRNAN